MLGKLNERMLDVVCILMGLIVIPVLGILAVVMWALMIGLVFA